MSNVIQNVINSVLEDGARPAKFRFYVNSGSSEIVTNTDVLCKTSSFPGRELDTIDVKYKGRSILIPGQQKYTQSWELTFYLEEDHKTRIFFDNWLDSFNSVSYKSNPSLVESSKTTLEVTQLNFDMDSETVKYSLYNAFPVAIGEINLGSEEVGAIGEYTVTFAYTHYTTESLETNLNANELADRLLDGAQDYVTDTVQTAKDKLAASVSSYGTNLTKEIKSAFSSVSDYLL